MRPAEVTKPDDPRLPAQRLDVDSFLVDSYPGDRGVLQLRRGDEPARRAVRARPE